MQSTKAPKLKTKRSKISYAKWGYIFITPFFLAYALFHFAPQMLTIYNSFFENYREGLTQVGPNFVGLKNYITLFTPDKNGTIDILKYAGNTIVLWLGCAVPQVVISLMLACFFTSYRLKIKGQQFFKTVIYMPNLIMASAFSMLFYMLFSNVGPVNQLLTQAGWIDAPIDFFNIRFTVRSLISLMNFLMWFGNTTILLMAGIMGIDQSLFEAANIDGATSLQVFFKVTLPLLMPILVYTVITALIGGLQMFENLINAWNDSSINIPRGMLNSFVIAAATAILSTYFSALTAYGLHAYQFKLKRIAFLFIMAVMVIPKQVSAAGFVQLCYKLKLTNSYLPLILPGIAAPVVFFYMIQYMKSVLPMEIVEAARVDGSGEFFTFNRIVLPMLKPAISVQLIFTFVESWNNYFLPALLLDKAEMKTVPIMIAQLRAADYSKFDLGKVYMFILLAILPVLLVYIFLSRYIVKGVTAGSVKG